MQPELYDNLMEQARDDDPDLLASPDDSLLHDENQLNRSETFKKIEELLKKKS